MNSYEDETFNSDTSSWRGELNSLRNSEFYNCHFENFNFVGKDCQFSKFLECTFENVNFSNALISGSTFRDCKFNHSKLTGINWSDCSSLSAIGFDECILDLSIFSQMNLKKMIFKNSKIHQADFSESNLEEAVFCGSDLRETTFAGANLMKADFRSATNYSIDLAYTKIRKAKFSFPEVIALLESQDIEIEGYR